MRKGYFEEADGGTVFLDEIAELPMATQAKLLRVLQSGEFIRVGSSKVLKTDVRVIAATNVDLLNAVSRGKFRADLYYRLNSVVIKMPALRERAADIHVLFRKFASDFSAKYGMAKVALTDEAVIMLRKYRWPGNIRQLKNVAEAVSSLESSKMTPGMDKCVIGADVLSRYIPKEEPNLLPATVQQQEKLESGQLEAIIRTLFQLKQEVDYLKDIVEKAGLGRVSASALPSPMAQEEEENWRPPVQSYEDEPEEQDAEEQVLDEGQEQMSIKEASFELIEKVLRKHGGNRKSAAAELKISERTLYRKLKQMQSKNDDK